MNTGHKENLVKSMASNAQIVDGSAQTVDGPPESGNPSTGNEEIELPVDPVKSMVSNAQTVHWSPEIGNSSTGNEEIELPAYPVKSITSGAQTVDGSTQVEDESAQNVDGSPESGNSSTGNRKIKLPDYPSAWIYEKFFIGGYSQNRMLKFKNPKSMYTAVNVFAGE